MFVDYYLDIDGHNSENKVNWLLSDCLRLERTMSNSEISPDTDAGRMFNGLNPKLYNVSLFEL